MVLVNVIVWGGVKMADIEFIGVQSMLGSGTALDPFQVKTAKQLYDLSVAVNAGGLSAYYYIQTAHLNLSGYANWTPIGTSTNPFAGVYDGNGLTISNLVATGIRVGLFGYLGNGLVKNVIIESGTITGTNLLSVCGGICAAMVVSTTATITGCINKATIVGVTTNGSDVCYIGGIAGIHSSNGTISDCANLGAVTNNSTSSGTRLSGGICGYALDANQTVARCFNAGAVTGNGTRKAISGIECDITNSYYDSTTSVATSTKAVGRATALCVGSTALDDTDHMSALSTTTWRETASYPVPIRTR